MGRPRSYDERRVVAEAERAFWAHGYAATSIEEIEAATGVNRSSLYHAFGTKEGLFDASLSAYIADVTDALFRPVEAPGAGLAQAAGYFAAVAGRFERRGAQRGCLLVNTLAERAGRDPGFAAQAAEFIARFEAAFSNALAASVAAGAMDANVAADRARMLAATTLGVWLAVRVDPAAAAAMCEAVATQVRSWA
jgi:TetR/AcrR family transcriptional repressor of nem operon